MKTKKEIQNNTKEEKHFNNFKMYFFLFLKYIYILLLAIFLYIFVSKVRYQNVKNNIQNGIVEAFDENLSDKENLKNILKNYSKLEEKENKKKNKNVNKNEKTANEKRKQIIDRYGINENFLEEENIYKKEYKKDLAIFLNLFLFIYIIYIYFMYKKEKEVLKDIKDVRTIIEDNLNGNVYFKALDFKENEKSDEKSLINKSISNIFSLKMEEEKNKQNIEEFISDIAHQLRVPISNISLKVFLLKKEIDEKDSGKIEKIKKIEDEINKISFLIEELLKMARLDSKTIKFEKEEVEFNEFIEKILDKFKYLIELKDIDIEFEKDDGTLNIDIPWTEEAVGNILKNAIEHTEEKNKIEIYLQKTGMYNRIVIKDEGEGMEKEEIKNIFKRFYKGKNSDKKSIGIGINIAKKIIEEQDGYIDVKSEKGKGSEFRINILK